MCVSIWRAANPYGKGIFSTSERGLSYKSYHPPSDDENYCFTNCIFILEISIKSTYHTHKHPRTGILRMRTIIGSAGGRMRLHQTEVIESLYGEAIPPQQPSTAIRPESRLRLDHDCVCFSFEQSSSFSVSLKLCEMSCISHDYYTLDILSATRNL